LQRISQSREHGEIWCSVDVIHFYLTLGEDTYLMNKLMKLYRLSKHTFVIHLK